MKPFKPGVVVTGQTLAFSQTPQVDAEGQSAVRRFRTEAPAGPGSGGMINAQGSIPAVIEYNTTAGDLANSVKSSCSACKYHSVKAWRKYVDKMTGPASSATDRQTIQTLRGRILVDGVGLEDEDGELDVEATLMSFGICTVLSDWVEGIVGQNGMFWPIAPSPAASCPGSISAGGHTMPVCTPAEPLGLFKPRDLDARKISAKKYDSVLFDASVKR